MVLTVREFRLSHLHCGWVVPQLRERQLTRRRRRSGSHTNSRGQSASQDWLVRKSLMLSADLCGEGICTVRGWDEIKWSSKDGEAGFNTGMPSMKDC
jgi:hypothetical protein